MIRALKQRPPDFRLNRQHEYFRGSLFRGLAWQPGSVKMRDGDGQPGYVKNHGTLTNGPTWQWSNELGRWGNIFTPGATISQFILSPSNSVELGLSTAGTWAAWAKAYTVDAYGTIFNDYLSNQGMAVRFESTGNVVGYVYPNNHRVTAVSAITSGVLYHIAMTFQTGGNVILYINGQPAGTPVAMGSDEIGSGNSYLGIGYHATSLYGFHGEISDPCIWNRALSVTKIQRLADPSNVMLDGLILPPSRVLFPVATTSTPVSSYTPMFFHAF